jgi:hypothetical protein
VAPPNTAARWQAPTRLPVFSVSTQRQAHPMALPSQAEGIILGGGIASTASPA